LIGIIIIIVFLINLRYLFSFTFFTTTLPSCLVVFFAWHGRYVVVDRCYVVRRTRRGDGRLMNVDDDDNDAYDVVARKT